MNSSHKMIIEADKMSIPNIPIIPDIIFICLVKYDEPNFKEKHYIIFISYHMFFLNIAIIEGNGAEFLLFPNLRRPFKKRISTFGFL